MSLHIGIVWFHPARFVSCVFVVVLREYIRGRGTASSDKLWVSFEFEFFSRVNTPQYMPMIMFRDACALPICLAWCLCVCVCVCVCVCGVCV